MACSAAFVRRFFPLGLATSAAHSVLGVVTDAHRNPRESYVADAALFDLQTQKVWLAVGAALLVLFPFMASDYWLYLACLVSINVASSAG